ncbi:hypothetical protein C2845_PM11G05370 [Panicum miliaceum]|uniref:Uncharacterized protein n=1 Tax=Panicum miliaceum TaxID=4540 RepID=A0A3L6RQD3_PANMI|nr:hypothetical protein C2845_PM11G05370 [Panicum miliaceum]
MESSSRFRSRRNRSPSRSRSGHKMPHCSPSRSGSCSRSRSSVVTAVTWARSFDFAGCKFQTTVTSSGTAVEIFLQEVRHEDPSAAARWLGLRVL